MKTIGVGSVKTMLDFFFYDAINDGDKITNLNKLHETNCYPFLLDKGDKIKKL